MSMSSNYQWLEKFKDDPAFYAKLKQSAEESRWEMEHEGMEQAHDLIAAGWRWELPNLRDPEVFQWYWRRPPRRKGSKGMKFWSTGQAHRALMRERAARS